MHKVSSLWKFAVNWSLKLRENDERKHTLVEWICVPSDRNKRLLDSWKSFNILVRNYLFLKIYAISEGAVSHDVLYYQQLSNDSYQVGF